MMSKISKLFDSTLLLPDVSRKQVIEFITRSVQYDVRAIAVPWCFVPLATELTKASDVGIVVGIDFPFGYSPVDVKIAQINYYSRLSTKITDFDVVLNLCAIKSGDWDYVRKEVEQIAGLVKKEGKVCKVIVEVCRLSTEELREVCELVVNIDDVDYVKTGTGFGPRATNYEDVMIMKEVLGDRKKIKVSGGVRTADQVRRFLQLGVSLFGSSQAVEIIREMESVEGI